MLLKLGYAYLKAKKRFHSGFLFTTWKLGRGLVIRGIEIFWLMINFFRNLLVNVDKKCTSRFFYADRRGAKARRSADRS